ncbi:MULTISPECIES: hypothetical protein [Pseudomonas]|uniref:hypothetical protein n=1 Tax=Pseudomonadaceae TaxID=135621 RepID=UPI00084A71E1|nr:MULTISPECIES: hypothetical protein [Pseudomonas]MCO7557338.1 hypothetical protein [Pseudomonas otitidis]MDH1105678.1 hypothetical protein [Pseudomonas otitidis]MDH1160109.1 hypothetical protein [Pseudomonas otitidis]MDH1164491.1 hypothetical protein [Pseudomonas otitidis]OEC61324.1 hypothetical protein A9G05_04260 [Pseudomonas sp. ENNP23]
MTEEEYKLEYERQLASLPPLVAAQIEQLKERAFAQEIVIAWLLAQVQRVPGLRSDHARRFLSRMANEGEQSESGQHAELVALADELHSLLDDFEQPR